MTAISLKPRWETWENICIQKAFAQKIQYKIMALALGKTVPAVSKKIKNLGLRTATTKRGRIKGSHESFSWAEKTPNDVIKMVEILKTYAPLKCFQKGQFSLQNARWNQCSFSYHESFSSVPLKDSPSLTAQDLIHLKDPAYVSLQYVEQWAASEGFQRTDGALKDKGVSYWKDGVYFSQAQLLMFVNRYRFEHHLQPLTLMRKERKSQQKEQQPFEKNRV